MLVLWILDSVGFMIDTHKIHPAGASLNGAPSP